MSLPLRNVFIVGSESGETNLWIDKLNISNSQDKNFIKFQGEGNRLNIIGKNKFNDEGRGTRRTAVINIGGGLTVAANSDPKAQIDFTAKYENHYYHGALIGSDEDEDLSSSNITIYGGTFTSDITRDVAGMIGSGGNAGDIMIQNSLIEMKYTTGTNEPAIGASNYGKVGNISITDSTITYKGKGGAAIGTIRQSRKCQQRHSFKQHDNHCAEQLDKPHGGRRYSPGRFNRYGAR